MMLDRLGNVIYIGKAKNLRKRVSSYFYSRKDIKIQQLLSHVDDIEITVTANEVEAILLEQQLIHQLKPKCNIIFRDDKSYPYIKITNEEYPQLTICRGRIKDQSEYRGPYTSTNAVRETIDLLQRIFKLRQCNSTFFKNRSRPCLQYQLKRCSAPCVGLINKDSYIQDLQNAKMFLQGKTNDLINNLVKKMENSSLALEYERAAKIRDQIVLLRKIQKHQIIVDPKDDCNVDVLSVANSIQKACVHVLNIRDGRIIGSRQYFSTTFINNNVQILEAFILQHYANLKGNVQLPDQILISFKLKNKSVIETALQNILNKKILINNDMKGNRIKWIEMANRNAEQALSSKMTKENKFTESLKSLAKILNYQKNITLIECFDISHTQGEFTIGACVVFDKKGPLKSCYRRYNVHAAKGDDYAAMEEVLNRHYVRLIAFREELPNLVLVDGGRGQLAIARKVVEQLKLPKIILIGIAKGVKRKPGLEKLYFNFDSNEVKELDIEADSTVLQTLQVIRDEAHRFAITGHRTKRNTKVTSSKLENITGIGVKRRQDLLKQFGGLQEVLNASVEELARIPGISAVLAKRIYDALHDR